MQRRVLPARKQGAEFGHTKSAGKSVLVRGLNTLAATLCTPLAAPVITATRLRSGTASGSRVVRRNRIDPAPAGPSGPRTGGPPPATT